MIYVSSKCFIVTLCQVCHRPTNAPIESETRYCGRICRGIAKRERYVARQALKTASNDTAIESDSVQTVKGKDGTTDATGNELDGLQAKGLEL